MLYEELSNSEPRPFNWKFYCAALQAFLKRYMPSERCSRPRASANAFSPTKNIVPNPTVNCEWTVERTRLTCMAADPFDNQNEPRLEPTVGTPQWEYENQNEPRMEHGLNTDGKDRQSRRACKPAKQRMPKQSVRNGPTVPPTGPIRVSSVFHPWLTTRGNGLRPFARDYGSNRIVNECRSDA